MSGGFETFETSDEDFGVTQIEATATDSLTPTFAPWHKPRKQWVRAKQWWGEMEKNIIKPDGVPIENERIRYLGLPGEDLLDIRFFQKCLAAPEFGKGLYVLGFINGKNYWSRAQTQLSKAIDMGLHQQSKIEAFDFDQLEQPKSLAFQKVREAGPFDILNLDFCDNIISPSLKNRRLIAIRNLVDYQLQFQSRPWLLYITTRSSKASSNIDVFQTLLKLITDNLQDQNFAAGFSEKFASYFSNGVLDQAIDDSTIGSEKHITLYIVGLLKWIFTHAVARNCSAKLTSIVRYDIDGDSAENDMISLAILFKKRLAAPPRDTSGVTVQQSDPEPEKLSEPLLAARAVSKVAAMKCVDNILLSDPKTYASVTKAKIELLKAAGRDVSTYIDEMCSQDLKKMGISRENFLELILLSED